MATKTSEKWAIVGIIALIAAWLNRKVVYAAPPQIPIVPWDFSIGAGDYLTPVEPVTSARMLGMNPDQQWGWSGKGYDPQTGAIWAGPGYGVPASEIIGRGEGVLYSEKPVLSPNWLDELTGDASTFDVDWAIQANAQTLTDSPSTVYKS